MRSILRKIIPRSFKNAVYQLPITRGLTARKMAKTNKRLDICAAQTALNLHLAKVSSVEGKVCLEVGCGWVLSHALIYHLLGAKKVIATDLSPLACPQFLHEALPRQLASTIRDILSPFCDHLKIRKRLDNILKIKKWDFDTLKTIGIEYRAPINFAATPLSHSVDFIYSNSVLEHVPVK